MKIPRLFYCHECATDLSFRSVAHKLVLISALTLGCLAFAQPPSSEGNAIRIEGIDRRLVPLEGLVGQVSEMRSEITDLKIEVQHTSAAVEEQATQVREAMGALILLLLTKVLGAFGVRFKSDKTD